MIDFNAKGLFARLKRVENDAFSKITTGLLIEGEQVVAAYRNVRDGMLFTNKRIITINVQGVTGKKQDYTSIPYSKIVAYSLETAGSFDLDAELELHLSGLGRLKFNFVAGTDVKTVCRIISAGCL